MRHKTTHFLAVSFILASVFCMIVFHVQTTWMNRMGGGKSNQGYRCNLHVGYEQAGGSAFWDYH